MSIILAHWLWTSFVPQLNTIRLWVSACEHSVPFLAIIYEFTPCLAWGTRYSGSILIKKNVLPPQAHYNTNLVDLTECWNPSKSGGCGNRREQFLHWVGGGINLLCDSALIGKRKICRSQLRDASLLVRRITMIRNDLMRCVWSRMYRSS